LFQGGLFTSDEYRSAKSDMQRIILVLSKMDAAKTQQGIMQMVKVIHDKGGEVA